MTRPLTTFELEDSLRGKIAAGEFQASPIGKLREVAATGTPPSGHYFQVLRAFLNLTPAAPPFATQRKHRLKLLEKTL